MKIQREIETASVEGHNFERTSQFHMLRASPWPRAGRFTCENSRDAIHRSLEVVTKPSQVFEKYPPISSTRPREGDS